MYSLLMLSQVVKVALISTLQKQQTNGSLAASRQTLS